MFGPTDLTVLFEGANPRLMEQVFGTSDRNSEVLKRAGPVNWVSADDPPFLILHGERDPLVPVSQSQIFYEKLQAAGVSATLVIVKNAGHSFAPMGGPISPKGGNVMRGLKWVGLGAALVFLALAAGNSGRVGLAQSQPNVGGHPPRDPIGRFHRHAQPSARHRDHHRRQGIAFRRGARPCAPTSCPQIIGIIHRRFQIGYHPTDQSHPWHAGNAPMATQLLRARHPHRGRAEPDSRVYCRKSLEMGMGREPSEPPAGSPLRPDEQAVRRRGKRENDPVAQRPLWLAENRTLA